MKEWKTPMIIEIDEETLEKTIWSNARSGGCGGCGGCGGGCASCGCPISVPSQSIKDVSFAACMS